MASSKLSKTIVFKEESESLHHDKLKKIRDQSVKVVRQYLKIQWSQLWPTLRKDFEKPEFKREKKNYEENQIKLDDLQLEQLDLSTLCKILQKGSASPVCYKNPLYEKAWTNPKQDLQNKFGALRIFLRNKSGNNNSTDENDQIRNEIMQICVADKFVPTLASYLWLLNKLDERFEEDILDAKSIKHGLSGLLGALTLVMPDFQPEDYAFVVTLSVLKNLRNKYAHDSGYVDIIPKAAFEKDFKLIQKCIQSLLNLMSENIDDLQADVIQFRKEIEDEVENISNLSSYTSETVYDRVTTENKEQQPITSSNVSQAQGEFYCSVCNLYLNKIPFDEHLKGTRHEKNLKRLNTVTPSVGNVADSSAAVLEKTSHSIDAISDEQKEKLLKLVLFDFINSFEPLKGVCYLKILGIFTPSDCAIIHGQVTREEKVVEFLSILQTKENWFIHLTEILKNLNYLDLLNRLQQKV